MKTEAAGRQEAHLLVRRRSRQDRLTANSCLLGGITASSSCALSSSTNFEAASTSAKAFFRLLKQMDCFLDNNSRAPHDFHTYQSIQSYI
ncbi:hypothetical protein M514_23195 [Trichuris suis]|uniref:Uncharacterized protein n=1 Tax=Trichuris suis TaxID=68888 RepID=A0A085N547_9BILA|nr:hypothetical protein M514_23195 [Trichuris suis]